MQSSMALIMIRTRELAAGFALVSVANTLTSTCGMWHLACHLSLSLSLSAFVSSVILMYFMSSW